MRFTIKSHGALKAPDPDKPLNLEGKGKTVRLSAVVTSWSNKCTLFTVVPGSGMGYVDAIAYPDDKGIGMVLELAPPVDLAWDVDYSFSCDGNAVTLSGVYPTTSNDPWISAHYFMGGGQQNVKIDMFEIPMQKLNGSPGVSVSYTATLTLEKVQPK